MARLTPVRTFARANFRAVWCQNLNWTCRNTKADCREIAGQSSLPCARRCLQGAAWTHHPEVAGRLDKTYLADTATVLGNVKTQATDQKQKRGQTGALSKAQLDKIHAFQLLIHNAKETAKLAFKGQTVMLRASFQVGVHKPHDLQSQLQRGRTVLASMQAAENTAALTAKGWTADETTALDTAITGLESDKTLLETAKDASVGLTSQKNVQADDLYDRLQTVQNAANLQWPDGDPANAQTRADFRLGKFPPKDHGGHHVEPTPTPMPVSATK